MDDWTITLAYRRGGFNRSVFCILDFHCSYLTSSGRPLDKIKWSSSWHIRNVLVMPFYFQISCPISRPSVCYYCPKTRSRIVDSNLIMFGIFSGFSEWSPLARCCRIVKYWENGTSLLVVHRRDFWFALWITGFIDIFLYILIRFVGVFLTCNKLDTSELWVR